MLRASSMRRVAWPLGTRRMKDGCPARRLCRHRRTRIPALTVRVVAARCVHAWLAQRERPVIEIRRVTRPPFGVELDVQHPPRDNAAVAGIPLNGVLEVEEHARREVPASRFAGSTVPGFRRTAFPAQRNVDPIEQRMAGAHRRYERPRERLKTIGPSGPSHRIGCQAEDLSVGQRRRLDRGSVAIRKCLSTISI